MLDTINREIFIDAPPATVWSIVTEPEHMAGWFSDEAVVDLRPGGSMVLTWHGHGTYRGRVETVEPPTTFAFRWLLREGSDPAEDASTLVVMTLAPERDGTKLRVSESGFAQLPWPEEERARYSTENGSGWLVELDELRAYVARATGRSA